MEIQHCPCCDCVRWTQATHKHPVTEAIFYACCDENCQGWFNNDGIIFITKEGKVIRKIEENGEITELENG